MWVNDHGAYVDPGLWAGNAGLSSKHDFVPPALIATALVAAVLTGFI